GGGAAHIVSLREAGAVVAGGADTSRQSGVPVSLGGVTGIAAGGYFTAALKADRTIAAWGDLSYGQRNVLAVNGVTAISAGQYHLALLTVAPVIVAQPTNQTVNVGDDVTFVARARGPEPLSYQWRRGAIDLPDATNADLTLSDVDATEAGDYSVVITNPFGGITSAVATLTVVPRPVYLAPTLTGPTDQ